MESTVLGYPRIGPDRELTRALEAYWSGRIDGEQLERRGAELRASTWRECSEAGLGSVPSNTFSFYDHVLDTAVEFDAVPGRFRELGLARIDEYFAMARGRAEVPPLEPARWFDTDYHYLVPELDRETEFSLAGGKPIAEFLEAGALGVHTRPVLLGPVTFLLLCRPAAHATRDFEPIELLERLLEPYAELLRRLADAGADRVQLDEPAFAADRTADEVAALRRAYEHLAARADRPSLMVAGYFGDLGDALPALAETPIEALAVDLVTAPWAADRIASIPALRDKTVVAGVIDGRNVWRTDLAAAASRCAALLGSVGNLAVSSSCSLLHVPYELHAEAGLPDGLRERLAFARQKLDELVLLGNALGGNALAAPGRLAEASATVRAGRGNARTDEHVRGRLAALRPEHRRRTAYAQRAGAQQARLRLPPLATTTVGSFPQTSAVRRARVELRAGRIDHAEYQQHLREEIREVIAMQERIGLDVLVHGEPERNDPERNDPERNDPVQHFAEGLEGMHATGAGWVQSFGSHCVRPPILHGDVTRSAPITVGWSTYAQSLTGKPVKGMLTGPVTILARSFVRDDQPLAVTADQVALALRDEIRDLEAAGLRVVQVDEPALRELLPLHEADRPEYLRWAVDAFRLATAGAARATQIHTHLCYSEFAEVVEAIGGLDADVTTIEAARSHVGALGELGGIGFARGVGPGVDDIHSPRVPAVREQAELLGAVPAQRLWGNPDCGRKPRGYDEIESALRDMVTAAQRAREG